MAPALPRRIWTALSAISPSIELMSVGSGGCGLARAVGLVGGGSGAVSASRRSLSLSTVVAPGLALSDDQAARGHAGRWFEAQERQHGRRHVGEASAILKRGHLRRPDHD